MREDSSHTDALSLAQVIDAFLGGWREIVFGVINGDLQDDEPFWWT